MLRVTLVLVFSFLIIPIQSQQLRGKVVESEQMTALQNVSFTLKLDNTISYSTEDGTLILPKLGIYLVEKEGYYSKELKLTANKYFIVYLNLKPKTLNEIVIKGTNFNNKLQQIPASVSVISNKEFNENTTNFSEIINTTPGVYMHSGTLTTNRITIRGIGSRNLYGTSKLKVYYEDIPLTNGSGESSVEDVELETIGSIEVIKGPASSLFGAGLGGAIILNPTKGVFSENSIKSNVTIGSFGLQKQLLQAQLGTDKNAANIVFSNIKSDGYRDNNNINKQSFTIASKHYLNAKNSLTILANYIDLKGFIPSSIDEETYINNPTAAAFTWGQAKGFEATKKGLLGISWKHNYTESTQQSTNVFYSNFDTYEVRPFNMLKEKTNGIGIRTKLSSKGPLFNSELNWQVGTELFTDTKKYATFENLYKQFPEGTGSVEGEKLSDLKEQRSYINLFFDGAITLTGKTRLTFGVNLNTTFYDLTDSFNEPVKNVSGTYNFDPKISPSFGITQQISNATMLFGSISHGFSNPTLEEILLPNQQLNSNIKPEEGWNFEIGSRGKLFQQKLKYALSIYQMNVKNLLVAKRISNDQFIGVNAGKTSYKGIEIETQYALFKNNFIEIKHQNNLSFNDYKFEDFIDFDENHSGNQLPGVPKISFNSNLNFETNFGLYTALSYSYFGKMPLRDDNTAFSKKYQLLNSTIGYQFNLGKSLSGRLFMKFNNILNVKYASMLLINATSFGGAKPRYYYPGEPTNTVGGFHLKYIFQKRKTR